MVSVNNAINTSFNYVTLNCSGSGVTTFQLERSVAGGSYVLIAEFSGSPYTHLDHDAVHGSNNTYRLTGYDVVEAVVGIDTTVATPNFKEWVLKDTDNYNDNDAVELFIDGDRSLQITDREDQARFTPLGRKYPIVIKDAEVKGKVIPLALQFINHAEYEAFDALRQRQKTLNLSGPRPQYNWYGVFASELEREVVNDVDGYSLVRVDFIETGNL